MNTKHLSRVLLQEAAKSKKWGGRIPPNLKLPLRDGDIDRPDDENYAGHMFFNAASKDAPQIVDRKVQPILDPMECGSGDYCNVSVNFYLEILRSVVAIVRESDFYRRRIRRKDGRDLYDFCTSQLYHSYDVIIFHKGVNIRMIDRIVREKRIDGNAEQIRDIGQKGNVGRIGIVFPFGNGLVRNAQFFRNLILCQIFSQS